MPAKPGSQRVIRNAGKTPADIAGYEMPDKGFTEILSIPTWEKRDVK